MKKYFYVLLTGACLLLSSSAIYSQVRFGIKAGLNMASVDFRQPQEITPDMLPSFQVGGLAEFSVLRNAWLGVGLEAHGKGFKLVSTTNDYKLSLTTNPVYLQLPVKFILKNSDGGVFGGIGAYFAYGIAGTLKLVQTPFADAKKISDSESIQFGNSEQDDLNPLDFGIEAEFGYETKNGIRITAEYSAGLADLRTDAAREAKIIPIMNHRVASICVAYLFAGKSEKSTK